MITKTAVQYASVGLVKEAFNFKPIMGGLKTGFGKVKNFFGNMFGGGAGTQNAAQGMASMAPHMRQVTQGAKRSGALARGQQRMIRQNQAKAIRQANSVPKQTTTPTPAPTTTPMPNQTTTPMPGNPNATPQFTQEQMNAAKNSNLLGGAVIGAGALGGINYVGNRVFAQPQRPPMMPMMMPMPMSMY